LLTDAAPARLNGGVVLRRCPAMQDAARPELFLEFRILRIVEVLWVFFRIQVIEVAEELVETVYGGQVLVLITEVVLTELPGSVTHRLKKLRRGPVACLQPHGRARRPHFRKAGAQRTLSGNEARAPRRTTLFGVVIGEDHPFASDPVDVGGAIPHETQRIG